MTARPGSWTTNLTLLVLVVLGMLGAGEIVARQALGKIVLFPRYVTEASYGDFVLRRLRPNTEFWHTSPDGSWKFVTNTQGFRDFEDYAYDKPEGVVRILSLGDSHTQGFEVRQERTFSEVIERQLRGEGVNAQVLNTGISGFSTAEELAFLENEGVRYEPDVVVLGFFANDFKDNIKSGLFALEDDALVTRKTRHVPGVRILDILNATALPRWLSENSYLFSFAMNTVWNAAKRALLTRAEMELQTEYAVPTGQVMSYEKELARRLVERMYAFCRRNGIALVILDIPHTRKAEEGGFGSSVPPELVGAFRANSDAFVSSEEVLGPYRRVAEIHLPRGHRHISEFSHMMLGLAAAERIRRIVAARTPAEEVGAEVMP